MVDTGSQSPTNHIVCYKFETLTLKLLAKLLAYFCSRLKISCFEEIHGNKANQNWANGFQNYVDNINSVNGLCYQFYCMLAQMPVTTTSWPIRSSIETGVTVSACLEVFDILACLNGDYM